MEPGQVMCFKTTGELCIILKPKPVLLPVGDNITVELPRASQFYVRRPVSSHENGISHREEIVYAFELETVEEHLRREAKEMVLKIQIQEEMTEAIDQAKKGTKEKPMVN